VSSPSYAVSDSSTMVAAKSGTCCGTPGLPLNLPVPLVLLPFLRSGLVPNRLDAHRPARCRVGSGHDEAVSSTLVPLLCGVLAPAFLLGAAQLGAWILVATPLAGPRPRSANQAKSAGRDS
jgi:hypothetical protein